MPQKRSDENADLPARWRYKHGAYHYRVPKGGEIYWGVKQEYKLGKTLEEAEIEYLRKFKEAAAIQPPSSPLLSIRDAASMATEFNPMYIYFLFDDDECVYIGKSRYPADRIEHHISDGKKFNRQAVITCDPAEADVLEMLYISTHKPKYNTVQYNAVESILGTKVGPLS